MINFISIQLQFDRGKKLAYKIEIITGKFFFFQAHSPVEKMAKMQGTNDRSSIDGKIRAEKKSERDERDEEVNPKG